MNRTILATTIAILTASVLCAGRADALVGADGADGTIARYTVLVIGAKGRCTGVVLAQDIVLTAAHCVMSGGKFWVGDGNQALPSWLMSTAGKSVAQVALPTRIRAVDKIVSHPLFSTRDKGSPDLAVLRLEKPLPDHFIPATLGPRHLAEGDTLIAAGYGKASDDEAKPAPMLRAVLLRITQAFRGWAILTATGEDRAGGAPGDSGGPLFAYRGMHTLVGLIVSVSDKQTRAVALAAHYGWIKEAQEKLGAR
jgi:hypothetical protein